MKGASQAPRRQEEAFGARKIQPSFSLPAILTFLVFVNTGGGALWMDVS